MSLFSSKWASPPLNEEQVPFKANEKPLPPTPAPADDERPNEVHDHKNVHTPLLPSPPASELQRPTPSPRPRTKLAWRGKSCWIALPTTTPETCGGNRPLSPAQVESRLKQFKEAGYNVDGFDLQPWDFPDPTISQSRSLYPDWAEDLQRCQNKDFKVFVPDPKAWKRYVDELMEQKLRALGVSIGDEPAAPPPQMSRQNSGQFQSVSPNMMHASVPGGSHRSTPSLAHFPTPGHSYSASVASPMSMPGDPRGHMHRHSVFGMPGMPFGFPGQQNPYGGMPAPSPSPHLNLNGMQRVASPAMERLKNDGQAARSPASPFGMPSPLARSPGPGEWPGQPHLRHQSVYSSFSPQPQMNLTPTLTPGPNMRQTPSLAEVPEDEEEPMQDYFSGATPRRQSRKEIEIAHPSPRHNRNISDVLEREIQGSDYHLEKSFERQLQDDEDEVNTSFASQASSSGAYLPPGKRASLINGTSGFGGQNQMSNLTSASSKPEAEKPTKDTIASAGLAGALQNKLTNKVKGHQSRLSVAAPEFKFKPAASFQPTLPDLPNFSNFQPPSQGHIRNHSSGDYGVQAHAFQPSSFGAPPSSDFSFSSVLHFNPVATTQPPAPVQAPVQPSAPSIFGNVSIPEVVKPARRSKAIAIVQPKASPVKEEPEPEDEDGRAVPSEDRQKRARVGQDDGDDVPLFAERPSSPARPDTVASSPAEEVESKKTPASISAPEQANVSEEKGSANEDPEPEPTPVQEQDSVMSAFDQADQGHKKNSSSLSALAKPFDFRPQDSTSNAQLSEFRRSPDPNKTKPDFSPSRVFSHTAEKTTESVEDLDYAPSPEPQKQLPYPNGDAHDPRFPEPTFDEIDAVMQQLNDEDDDYVHHEEFLAEDPSPDASVIHHSPSRNAQDRAVPSLPEFRAEQFRMPSASVHRLNRDRDVPLSEWSDDLSVDEATKLQTRSRFFDHRIDQIVGNILENRLAPLEKSLSMIHRAVSSTTNRETRPATGRTLSMVDSDADDEEDETSDERQSYRPLSRAKDKKANHIKAAVLEALATQQANAPQFSSATEIHDALITMNTTIARIASSNIDVDDVKHIVDESLHRHGQALTPAPVPVPTENPETVQKHKRELSELNGRLNKTLADALEEANQRRTIEEREVDTRRLLRLAEEELSLLRATMGDKDQRIHSLEGQLEEVEQRADAAESAQVRAEKQLSDLEAENTALESTLEEYRLSSTKWRQEVDETTHQNEALKASVFELKEQLDDSRVFAKQSSQEADNATVENKALKASAADLVAQLEESHAYGKQAKQAADNAAIEATAIKASAAELMTQLEESQSAYKLVQQVSDDAAGENLILKARVADLVMQTEDSRLAVQRWQHEAETTADQNATLKDSVSELKAQIADGLKIRENMRSKLDKIHNGMISAAEQLANEKAIWQNRNEELQKKYVVLQARLEGEHSVRRSIEEEVQSLRSQVHDGVTAKIQLEQLQRSNTLHEETLSTLKDNLSAEQALTSRLERDLHEARESGRAEVQRTQMIMQSSIEAAESQAGILRAGLEHELMLAKNEIDNIKMVADAARERHDLLLEQEADLRRDALRRVNETSSAALNDLREKHSDEIQYITAQHERSIANAYDDKQRAVSHYNDRLELSNDQVLHLRDKVAHLEERLVVAKSAAQAAVSAAQAAKTGSAPALPASATSSVVPSSRDEPERISPQALRESILVLQEQLQERESRIERLQNEISSLDTNAPIKLKEKETEVSWLRELLSVRNEDLNELIKTISKPNYDRDAVRDFAIRIRANLQMEQQEKERLISAGSSLTGQALANLTNFASPKAVSLAAAFGNWRSKGKDNANAAVSKLSVPSSLRPTSRPLSAPRVGNPRTRTPSKPSPMQSPSVFAGLMTPPATNFRRTPSPAEDNASSQRSSLSFPRSSQPQREAKSYFGQGQANSAEENPNVFRRQSYDEDAQLDDVDAKLGDEEFEEEEEEAEDDDEDGVSDQTPEELVGRSLANELEAA